MRSLISSTAKVVIIGAALSALMFSTFDLRHLDVQASYVVDSHSYDQRVFIECLPESNPERHWCRRDADSHVDSKSFNSGSRAPRIKGMRMGQP